MAIGDYAKQAECPPELDHRWAEFESWVASGRFCTRCDREEWSNGVVRPGWRYTP